MISVHMLSVSLMVKANASSLTAGAERPAGSGAAVRGPTFFGVEAFRHEIGQRLTDLGGISRAEHRCWAGDYLRGSRR